MIKSKTYLKILSVLAVGIFAVYFSYNKSEIELRINSLFNSPADVQMTNITDNSFTVIWRTNSNDHSVVQVTQDVQYIQNIDEVSYNGNLSYFIDDRDTTVDITEALSPDGLYQLGKYRIHHVTVNNIDPTKKVYFAISNGQKIWNVELGNNSYKSHLDNDLYYSSKASGDEVKSNTPNPIVLSISSEIDVVDSIAIIEDSNSDLYSYIVNNNYEILDASNIQGTVDLVHVSTHGLLMRNSFEIDTQKRDIDNRIVYLNNAKPIAFQFFELQRVAAANNVCCAIQEEDGVDFYGTLNPDFDTCNENDGSVIPNITTERACNVSFSSVCCNTKEGYKWSPEISCLPEKIVDITKDKCTDSSEVISSEKLSILKGSSSFLIKGQAISSRTDGKDLTLADLLDLINKEKRNAQWIAVYDEVSKSWKYAAELGNGITVSNPYTLSRNSLVNYYSSDSIQLDLNVIE
jgi:hypothetical protein